MDKVAVKVVYGLKNLYYAILTNSENGNPSYGKVTALPGAVNLGLTADGDIVEFYADDCVYYATYENGGYTGDIELANVPNEFLKDVFGFVQDDSGYLYEVAGVEPKHIALMGEFKTDAVAKRITLYDVLCSRPDISRKTKEKTPSPQTQKMSLTARPIEINGKYYVKNSSTPEMSEETYKDYFKSVKLPAAAASVVASQQAQAKSVEKPEE